MKAIQREILLGLHHKKNDDFFYENNPFDVLIHAVLNTIQFECLLNIYVKNSISELNPSIISNLNKRVYFENNLENIYESLKEIIETNNEYRYSQRLRIAAEILLKNLSDDYKSDFFNTFFNSKYLNDKKAAIKFLSYTNRDVINDLLELFIYNHNTIFLEPILNKENRKKLTRSFFEIWRGELSFYYKKKLIECIIPVNREIENFIKNNDDELFFHLRLMNNEISRVDLLHKIETTAEDKKHFYIWQASKTLKFEDLEEAVRKYIN